MENKETDTNRHKPTNKEIAKQLGKSERTIERWGKDRALEEYYKSIENEPILSVMSEEIPKITHNDLSLENEDTLFIPNKITYEIVARKLNISVRTVEKWGKEKAYKRYKEHIIDNYIENKILQKKISVEEMAIQLKESVMEQIMMDLTETSETISEVSNKEDRLNYRLELIKSILKGG